MTDILTWLGGTFIQWLACIGIALVFVLIARPGTRGHWRKLGFLALFFFVVLLLVRLEIFWDFLRSPWQGMILEAVFAILVITLTKTTLASGLTVKVEPRAWRTHSSNSKVLRSLIPRRPWVS